MLLIDNLNSRYLAGACVILAALVGITFFYVITAWHHDWELTHRLPAPAETHSTQQTAQLIAQIPSYHLFGRGYEGDDMPISSLQLQVTGIMHYIDEQGHDASKALISLSGQPAHVYQVGETLSGDVKINRITTDAVILENDGQLEKLPLPRKALTFKPPVSEEPKP